MHIGHDVFIISATTPFTPPDLERLNVDARQVVQSRFPTAQTIYEQAGYTLLPQIDRVYVNSKAVAALGWQPHWSFESALAALAINHPFSSDLALAVGRKPYHDSAFAEGVKTPDDGPYPV